MERVERKAPSSEVHDTSNADGEKNSASAYAPRQKLDVSWVDDCG